MGWRPSTWWGRSRDRQPAAELSTIAAVPQAEAVDPPRTAGAWRDLPALTPLAASPVQRIAVRDDFRSGLAAHADPRFLRPLAHQVDPTVGGLVDGLAAVGQPSVHDGGPDLSVPTQRAAKSAPRVQRRMAWSGSDELTTVRWQLPDMPIATEVSDVVPESDRATEAASGRGGERSDSSVPDSSPVPDSSSLYDPPGSESPLIGTPAVPDVSDDSASPIEQVLQVEQAVPLEPPRLPRSDPPAVLQRTLSSLESASASALPVVSGDPAVPRSTDDAADAPLSGADPEASGSRSPLTSRPGPSPGPGPGPDHESAPTSSAVAAAAEPVVVTTPVVARTMTPPAPTATGQREISDLGPRPEPPLETAAPSGFTEVALPLASTRTIVPATGQPTARGLSDSVVPSATADTGATAAIADTGARAAIASVTGATSGATQVQRSLHVGAAVQPPTAAGAARNVNPPTPPAPTPDLPAERPTSGFVEADSFLTTITLGAVSGPTPGSSGSAPTDPRSGPAAQRLATGSAVVPPSSASSLSSPGRPSPAVGSAPVPPASAVVVGLPLVQRSSADHRPASSTVGEPVASGSARSFDSMFGGTSPSPIAATVTEPSRPSLAVATMQRQSFDDSSASTSGADTAEPPPATQPALDGGAGADVADATVTAASTSAGAAATPAAAVPSADVDEMARRLYEPLVARLRAELWLDRERSGVFGDG